jgi:hypothetical protein
MQDVGHASYGSYKITREVGVRGFVTTYLGERVGGGTGNDGPAEAVVKVMRPQGGAVEPENPEGMIVEFLDAARAQQRAARASQHWARVFETGLVSGGAYFVEENFDRSAQRLLDMQARLSARQLLAILAQSVAALVDLKNVSERPHGNLKPSNVLIRGNRPGAPGSVALAGPLPAALLTPAHAADDLEALGRLLYQLVTRSPSASHVMYPVEQSPEWTELGRGGARLRELCNLMLEPDQPADKRLAQLHAQLSAGDGTRRALRLAVILGAIVLLGVPAWAYARKHGLPLASLLARWTHAPQQKHDRTGDADQRDDAHQTDAQGHDRTDSSQRDDGSNSATKATTPTTDATHARVDVLRELMAARNRQPAFNVQLDAQVYPSRLGSGECLGLTIVPDEDCWVMVLCQDSAGDVSLLLPNAMADKCVRVYRGNVLRVQDLGFELPVKSPYGRTIIKVVATTKRLDLVGAVPNNQTGFLEGIRGLARPGSAGLQTRLAGLLNGDEWTTTEAEIVTRPAPGKPAGGTGGPAAGGGGGTNRGDGH